MNISRLTEIAITKPLKKYENWAVKEIASKKITNFEKVKKIYPPAFLLFGGFVQGWFLYKSKDMPKERKIPLVLNLGFNDAIALLGGALTSKHTNIFKNKMLERAKILYAEHKNKAMLINGIDAAVPFFVSALLFKYIGPVLATPLADKANNFLIKKGWVDYSKKK